MKNKGFAISGIIYTLLVLFIILVIALLYMFNSRKTILDKLKEKVLNDINVEIDYTPQIYGPNDEEKEYQEYTANLTGYYELNLTSSNNSILKSTFYLKEGETLYLKVGSKTYNNGESQIYTLDNNTKNLLMQITNTTYYINENYNNRIFLNTNYTRNSSLIGNGNITINYIKSEKLNLNLNKVKYIRECLYSNSLDAPNEWSEIMAIMNGENKITNKITGTAENLNLIIDKDITTSTNSTVEGKSCVTIELDRTYNLDYIKTWHKYTDNRIYYNRELAVSTNGVDYKNIDNYELPETINGNTVSAYEISKTLLVGNVYLPVKKYLDATWLRIFHHNNRNGLVLWDSDAQVLTINGYNNLFKQSALYNIAEYVSLNNKYELLLEYPNNDSAKYNRWTQTSNFTTKNTITGYTPIKIDFNSAAAPFVGLKINGTSSSVVSGNTSWYYAVGARITYSKDGNTGILGYDTNPITGTVDLWVRIDGYLKN